MVVANATSLPLLILSAGVTLGGGEDRRRPRCARKPHGQQVVVRHACGRASTPALRQQWSSDVGQGGTPRAEGVCPPCVTPPARSPLIDNPNSGMIVPTLGVVKKRASPGRKSLADALFTRTQQRVLGVLFGQARAELLCQ